MLRLRFSLSNLIGAILVLMVVLSPFAVNLALNLKSLVPGMLLGQLIALPLLAQGTKQNHGIDRLFCIIFGVLIVFILVNDLASGVQLFNLLGFLLLLILMSINGSLFTIKLLQNLDYWRNTLTWTYFFLIALAVEKIAFDRGSILLIGEPSFFALVAGPIAMIVYSLNRNMGLVNILILLSLSLLLPNTTLLLFFAIQSALIIVQLRKKLIMVTLIALLLAVGLGLNHLLLSNEYFLARLTLDADSGNLSSLLFAANWLDVISRITSFQIFGSGVGSTADYLSASNDYEYRLTAMYGTDLIYTNGTFWFARALQTIGFAALVVPLIVIWKVLKIVSRTGLKTRKLHPMEHLELTLYLAIVPELFFRGGAILGFAIFLFFTALKISSHSAKMKLYPTRALKSSNSF